MLLTVHRPWKSRRATCDGPLHAAGTKRDARQALRTALEKTIEGPDLPQTRHPPRIGPATWPQRNASRIIDSARSSWGNCPPAAFNINSFFQESSDTSPQSLTSKSMTSKSSVRFRLLILTSMSQCHEVSMIAWLSSWLASKATDELVSTAPHRANPTATRDATMCRARTAAGNF